MHSNQKGRDHNDPALFIDDPCHQGLQFHHACFATPHNPLPGQIKTRFNPLQCFPALHAGAALFPVQRLVAIVDIFLTGGLGASAIAATGLGQLQIFVTMTIFWGLSTGTTVVIAHLTGAGSA
jgi:hypothetical protein